MAEVYLDPSDLSSAQAQTVLDFLNRAASAEQLGRDIEFPDEPDIGVRLGQRLLDARAALGGRYSDIRQVRSVRLIGPERFTEICVAALGLDPRRWVDLFFGGSPMAERAEEGLALALDVQPQPAWLGQPLTLFATVRSKSGEPRAGVPVTLHTDFGILSHAFGFTVSEGAAVTAITGADGRAELRLLTPPDEPLAAEQEAALLVALGRLDAAAPHPLALQAELFELAAEYALDRNYALRRAIDLYTRQGRNALVDSLNPGRWRLAWPMQRAVVRADAHPRDGGGTSLSHAVLALGWRNWVGPWVEFLAEALRRDSKLDERFQAAEGPLVITDLVGQAHSFLAAQPGLAAEWAGKRVIDQAVRSYVGKAAARLPEEDQGDAIAQLELGAQQMRPGTLGAYTVVTHSRSRLSSHLADFSRLAEGHLAVLERARSAVDERAAQVNQQALAVEAARRQVDERAGTLNLRFTQFDTQFSEFNRDYADFRVRRESFSSQLQDVRTDLSGISLKVSDLQRRRGGG